MNKFSKRGYVRDFSSVIVDISALAKKHKQNGEKVIDGTIGAFYDDNEELVSLSLVKQNLKDNLCNNLGYGAMTGGDNFKELMLKWFLKDEYEQISNKYRIPFCATVGGTGAVSAANYLFLDEGQTLLLPDIMWGNYTLIAKKNGLEYQCYKLFDESGYFNVNDLISRVSQVKRTQSRIAIIINDPCHNPTGYCMKTSEYRKLFDMLSAQAEDCDLTVLMDIAYIDYDECSDKKHRVFDVALERDYNFNIVFLFSCSKSFGVYGLRVGGMFAFTNDLEYERVFINSFKSFARGMYSSPNTAAISAICNGISSESMQAMRAELKANLEVLKERGGIVSSLLEESNIKHYPYSNGFFITIITEGRAGQVIFKLQKEQIYLVPMDENNIRISLANLKKEDIKTLIERLKFALC